ncbi:hypothetical protein PHMEG_0002300 [Phytophthora megakarya]|uniref:U6 snRNA phosphodiesterase n=1 Tax=Phytophthora megakarya TaxID=4795 RepID=A0A225WZS9_9STRA|nr:hypothetical protein PHMEG_0002300 [Phytophthora megakarya]
MESIAAAYGSSDDAASSDSEVECSESDELNHDQNEHVGGKRERSDEPQWKRAFPHVDGNWPSHVRIDIPVNQELRELVRHAIERAQEIVGDEVALVPFKQLESDENDRLHLSLSRPFVLTYDQINSFVDSLRAALKWRQRFSVTLKRALVLVNDDKTRSFLALRVGEGEEEFLQVLRCVDQCFTRFELPTYYKDPIPHVSVASSVGEELAKLTADQCKHLFIPQHQTAIPRRFTTNVEAVHVAIGNKHYDIPLR